MKPSYLYQHRPALTVPALAFSMLLAACSGKQQPEGAPAPLPAVTVTELVAAPVTLHDDLPGRVAALRSADIRPQVGGIVQRRLFEQGAQVKAGQALFQLNPAPFKAELDNAAAALQHAEAVLERTGRQAERLQALIDADAISRQSFDDAVSERELAAASVAQARATLERRRLDLAFATVQAPISGRIGQELVSEGALVGQGDSAPMARIQQIDQVYVDVRQPASMLARLRSGPASADGAIAVNILAADGTPYPARARLLFSDISIDAGTGDASVRILVENPDHALLPGMFVRARIARSAPGTALLAPQQAVQRGADGRALAWTLDKSNKASQRTLEVGPVIGHRYVVHSGLRAGDRLVVEGQERLQEGQQVTAQPWKAPATAAAPAVVAH
ncbi:MAG: efflux RND transporter periplasmic adaptor subunit [Duganella sp.]